jgi:hypothetical protein
MMHRHLKEILVFGLLLLTGLLLWSLFVGMTSVDIQLHDTYFVLDWTSWTFLIAGLVTFFFFLARGLMRRFSTRGTNIGLIVGLVAVSVILYKFLQMLLVVSGETAVYFVSGLIVLCVFGILLLVVRTYRRGR